MLKKRPLGRTGLMVSELALGGLVFGKDSAAVQAKVARAVQLGVNYIDTAAGYGQSEALLGPVLEKIDSPLILSTKLGYRPQPFQAQDKDCLLKCFEESLRLLRRTSVDILMIHEPDRPGQFDWWTDPVNFYGPVIDVLDQLKRQGAIRFTGLGGTTAYELANVMRTGRFDVVLTAFNYSLLWREAVHAILPAAKELKMGVIIGSPLQQGALARRYDEQVRHGARWLSPPRRAQYIALYEYLDSIGMSLPEAGLRFAISNPDVSCVLMGAATIEEVEQNVAAVEKGPLPAEVLKRLDAIAAMVPFRPYEEPFGLPFARNNYYGPGRGGR